MISQSSRFNGLERVVLSNALLVSGLTDNLGKLYYLGYSHFSSIYYYLNFLPISNYISSMSKTSN